MAKKARERRHAVHARLKVHELTKAGTSLELAIFEHGVKIGHLTIGRGSLFWRKGKAPERNKKRISWSRFAEVMNELAYG